ncbi:hypothetical protein FA95DRAFT_1600908 [Auriscalpium vulgare]|uniref:Uncharacterized protein n=1 Tax=Auriscalpium vulgare TaxID=40419 RepID=A0ACB8SD16_9AGAM|nr:hypothetical protein FA95DRAFT_1600908 [Auriscalpium vulgare]
MPNDSSHTEPRRRTRLRTLTMLPARLLRLPSTDDGLRVPPSSNSTPSEKPPLQPTVTTTTTTLQFHPFPEQPTPFPPLIKIPIPPAAAEQQRPFPLQMRAPSTCASIAEAPEALESPPADAVRRGPSPARVPVPLQSLQLPADADTSPVLPAEVPAGVEIVATDDASSSQESVPAQNGHCAKAAPADPQIPNNLRRTGLPTLDAALHAPKTWRTPDGPPRLLALAEDMHGEQRARLARAEHALRVYRAGAGVWKDEVRDAVRELDRTAAALDTVREVLSGVAMAAPAEAGVEAGLEDDEGNAVDIPDMDSVLGL